MADKYNDSSGKFQFNIGYQLIRCGIFVFFERIASHGVLQASPFYPNPMSTAGHSTEVARAAAADPVREYHLCCSSATIHDPRRRPRRGRASSGQGRQGRRLAECATAPP